MSSLLHDVRYGLRMLANNPGFTAVAVLTLALGIGGTTAIFSVLYCAVLRPFPYADSHRLAVVVVNDQRPGQGTWWARVSASEFMHFQEQNHVFDEVMGVTFEASLLAGTGAPELYDGERVTANTFRVLGVRPLIGRPITTEDAKPGAPPVVVLSHKAWRSKFGRDPAIIGRTITLNHHPTTVIGVMPPRFSWIGGNIWLPATLSRGEATGGPAYFVIGHLKPGITKEQASADVEVLSKGFATVYSKNHPPEVTFGVVSFTDYLVGGFRKTLGFLFGAVGVLLLIACGNVANLLLARATAREKEIAVRAALGASRGRLVRQLMIESLLLALGGAGLGCALAWSALDALVATIPSYVIMSEVVFGINAPVLLFTLGGALLSTLLFGLAPALHAVGKDLQGSLKASGRGADHSPRGNRLTSLLVVGEVALSLVLLTGGGLLIRSFFALRQVDLGYSPDHVLVAYLPLPEHRYKTVAQRNQLYVAALRNVRGLPGVVSAALAFPPPTWGGFATASEVTGKPSAENRSAQFGFASDAYFDTLGIRLIEGRTISEEDFILARKVAVVNRTLVTKYFGNESPLGRQIKLTELEREPYSVKPPWFEIVGMVADIRANGRHAPVEPQAYVPYTVPEAVAGVPWWDTILVRSVAEPASLLNSVRSAIGDIDKELPLGEGSGPLQDLLNIDFTEPRFVLTMMVGFASLGLTLVCIGVYSVLSYSVSRRTHEIGVRMALGAQATDVRRMVMMAGLRWLAVGIGIGVPASIALAKILQNQIWGIKSADPLTLVAVSLLLTVVGLAACYFPARRATKVDPMVALRYE